jgi:hypothetical protein
MSHKKLKDFVRSMTTQSQRILILRLLSSMGIRLSEDGWSIASFYPTKKPSDFSQPYRLHLGCGNIKIPSFCNVDVMRTCATDVIDDISSLSKFSNNSVCEIYACHVLEHFPHDQIVPILKRWFEVLIPGGIVRISVPDIDRIVKIYAANQMHFDTPGNAPWIGLIYGGQSTPYDYHKTGFNFCWLKYLMSSVGFEDLHEYPHEPHFMPGLIDASLAKEPFGQYLSLNMFARKPD